MENRTYTREEIRTAYLLGWMNCSGEKMGKETPSKHYQQFETLLDSYG